MRTSFGSVRRGEGKRESSKESWESRMEVRSQMHGCLDDRGRLLTGESLSSHC